MAAEGTVTEDVTTPEAEVTPKPDETSTPATQEPKTEATPPATEPEPKGEPLVTDEELEEIKKNPQLKKLYDAVNAGYTQKSQRLAAAARLDKALRENPVETLKAMASRYNLNLAEAAPKTPPKEEPSPDLKAALVEALGSDEAASKAAPAIERFIESRLKPLEERTIDMVAAATLQEAQSTFDAYKAKHPDITPELEAQMLEMSEKVLPGKGMTDLEYLDMLYKLTKPAASEADAIKAVIERTRKVTTATPSKPTGTPSKPTVVKAPEHPTAEDAARAAARGELWE